MRTLVGGTGELQTLTDFQPADAASDPWLLAAANGTFCGWGGFRGLRFAQQTAQSVIVELLPHAAAAWRALATAASPAPGAAYSGGQSLDGGCVSATPMTSCWTNVLVGDTWLSVSAVTDAGFSERSFHDYVQGIVNTVASAPVASAPPALPGRPACDAPGTTAEIGQAFGLSTVGVDHGFENRFQIRFAALTLGSASRCDYRASDGESRGWGLEVTRMSNADAVFAAAAASTPDVPRTPLTIDGVKGTAYTWRYETADSSMTVVDVLSQGTWLQVFVWGVPDPKPAVEVARKLLAAA